MNIEKFIQSTSEWCDAHSPEGRTDRFKLLMYPLLEHTKGNVCEVGAGFGLSTQVFLEAALKLNKQVLVIDPFDNPVYPFEAFWERVKDFENLNVCKMESNRAVALVHISTVLPIAFAFVDGAQLKDDVLFDLDTFAQFDTPIICVDDINRETPTSQVPEAVKEFLKLGTYRMIETRPLIECYLIKI